MKSKWMLVPSLMAATVMLMNPVPASAHGHHGDGLLYGLLGAGVGVVAATAALATAPVRAVTEVVEPSPVYVAPPPPVYAAPPVYADVPPPAYSYYDPPPVYVYPRRPVVYEYGYPPAYPYPPVHAYARGYGYRPWHDGYR